MQSTTYEDGRVLREFFGVEEEDPVKADTRMLDEAMRRLNEKLADPQVKKVETVKNIGRNAKCPCGSGRKFKKCCISKVKKV